MANKKKKKTMSPQRSNKAGKTSTTLVSPKATKEVPALTLKPATIEYPVDERDQVYTLPCFANAYYQLVRGALTLLAQVEHH